MEKLNLNELKEMPRRIGEFFLRIAIRDSSPPEIEEMSTDELIKELQLLNRKTPGIEMRAQRFSRDVRRLERRIDRMIHLLDRFTEDGPNT